MILLKLKSMPRGQRRSLFLGLLLFSPIPGLAIWHGLVNHWAGKQLDGHLAFLEAVGIPTHLHQISPDPENSDAEAMSHPAMIEEFNRHESEQLKRIDAYEHGHRIGGLSEGGFRRPSLVNGEILDVRSFFEPPRHDTETDAANELIATFLSERQRLREIAIALARPKAGWRAEPMHYEGIEFLQYPELMQTRRIVSALEEHTLLAMAAGDTELATEFLTAIHHAGLHSSREAHSLIHYLLARIYFDLWLELIREGIRREAWGEPTLVKFDGMLANSMNGFNIIEILKTELGHHASLLRQMKSTGALVTTNPFEDWVWELDEIRNRASEVVVSTVVPRGFLLKAHIEDAREYFVFVTLKDGAPRESFTITDCEHMRKRRAELEDGQQRATDPSLVWLLSSLLEHHLNHLTSAALLQAGIALERHRLKYGSHPESLDAIAPEFLTFVPLDPYDGQPLRYRRRDDAGGSPLVWSVGPNGVDEGGKIVGNRDEGDRLWITTPIAPP